MKFAGNESIVSNYSNTDQNLEFDENVAIFFFDTINECLLNISPNDSLLESMLVLGFNDGEACGLYIDYVK